MFGVDFDWREDAIGVNFQNKSVFRIYTVCAIPLDFQIDVGCIQFILVHWLTKYEVRKSGKPALAFIDILK